MARIIIIIEDVGEPAEKEIEINATGDTDIKQNATPAQHLANDCMKHIATIVSN